MTALTHTLVPIRDVRPDDVFVDSAWKDSALWGQTVQSVSFVEDALTPHVGRLVQLGLTGSCGLSTRETTIVEVLRSPITPTDTGRIHGPSLPDWGTEGFRHLVRLCHCKAVETGFPHGWHDRDCDRWAL